MFNQNSGLCGHRQILIYNKVISIHQNVLLTMFTTHVYIRIVQRLNVNSFFLGNTHVTENHVVWQSLPKRITHNIVLMFELGRE